MPEYSVFFLQWAEVQFVISSHTDNAVPTLLSKGGCFYVCIIYLYKGVKLFWLTVIIRVLAIIFPFNPKLLSRKLSTLCLQRTSLYI